MKRLKVEILNDIHQEMARKGDIGYIDGYVQCADRRPYAVVIINDVLSYIPIYSLKVLTKQKEK